ncbi:TonB-dependent receptor [Herbaspirillum sp. alder98]|uniref:TonB-dependent receptor n=1 Tax=Herbaspirillum sp. alder98 TaxID=2913096 RepID=UPI001CD8C0BE|nr:TonB-dependent siderophore receptor [Herbaspirillum sp. alder98]MCA1326282.1 TonB-dependent siderophore receptor [Herbaspirillum sp. alder98]
MGQVQASKRQRNSVFQLKAVASAARHLVLMAPMLAVPVAYAQTTATSGDATATPAATTNTGSNSNAVLPTVTVTESRDPTAPYAGGLVARGGSLGVLGTASVMDTPFSVTNYTSQGIEDVQARAIGDVIANDASVRNTNGNGGFGDSYQIRGFTMSANDVAFNGLYGMVPLTRMPITMVERIEVLKGPGTLMYGMGPAGGIGGAVNLVAKRAHEEPTSSVTATYLSNSQFGLKGDIGRRFGDNQEWGIRVNALYADGNTGLSGSNQQQSMGSVGLDYNGGRVRWSLDAYTQHEDSRNFRPQFRIAGLEMPEAPSGKTNLYPGTTLQSDDKAALTRLEYDINDSLTAYGAIGYHVASSAQSWPGANILNARGDTSALSNGYYDQKVTSTSADAGMRARFNTGGIKHTVMLGLNMLNQQTDYFFASQSTGVTSNLYNPVALPSPTMARTQATPQSQLRLTSFALTDTLSFADDRLRLIAGLRRQQVYSHSLLSAAQTSNKTAISPVLGVVVKPVENLSLYANYTAALTAGSIVAAPNANAGEAFPPSKSKQYETGAKIDWGRVTTSAAVFQIEQKNNSTQIINGVQYATQNGRARIRGLELAAYGEIQRGLRFNASGTFFDTKLAHTAGGTTDNNEVGAVPSHNFNLGLDWDTPWVSGLALNTRVARTGAMWYDQTNRVKVPGWTRADIGARYITKTAGQVVTYRANIENLFDKNYWVMQNGYVGTSSGRTFVLSAQVDF